MTSLPTSYTPLESLLLFQALRVEGVASPTFTRISAQLQAIPLVRSDPSYDAARLSPDALRHLFLDLLKDEAAQDLQHHLDNDHHPIVNGDTSPVSRKRKAPSPALPTLHETVQHSHLIPQLVARLYARYRDITVKEIRECERKHDTLCRDVGGVEDEARHKQQVADAVRSSQPSSLVHSPSEIVRRDHAWPASSQLGAPDPLQNPESKAPSTKYSSATIDAVINHGPESQQNPDGHHRRTSSNTTLPPISDIAPSSPRPAYSSATTQMQQLAPGGGMSYTQSPPAAQHSPYVAHHGQALANTAPVQQLQSSLSRPSSSPRPILPPPPGMQVPSQAAVHHTGSPVMCGPPLQQQYQPPPRASARPSPTIDRAPRAFPPSPMGYQQQPSPAFPDRRGSHPAQQGLSPASYTPTRSGGYQLPPFYLESAPSGNFPQKQQHVLQHQQQHTPRQIPPHMFAQSAHGPPSYPPAPATGPRHQPHNRLISDIVAALATPPRGPVQRPLWKSERRPRPIAIPSAPARPEVEPLSPKLTRKSPVRSGRSTRNNRTEKVDAHDPEPAPTQESRKGGRLRARNRSPHSVMSSTAGRSTRGRTRSESVSTAVSDGMHLNERPSSGGHVKNEPSTPAEIPDELETAPEPSTTPSGRMTRQRRGTLQSQPHLTAKRKRRPSTATADGEVEHFGTPPPRPTTVTAYRGFDKTSATLVENIGSHKHAVFFQGAVRNKDAQGYSEIIKQPQHLKGIKSAILAGRRAVAASSETGNIIELERSVDLMPPKSIVNGTQLEKEVMRIMANAAMFNPGEDGLVSDTREMFEDVEAMFAEWRDAEQETGGAGEEEETKGKRRKM